MGLWFGRSTTPPRRGYFLRCAQAEKRNDRVGRKSVAHSAIIPIKRRRPLFYPFYVSNPRRSHKSFCVFRLRVVEDFFGGAGFYHLAGFQHHDSV